MIISVDDAAALVDLGDWTNDKALLKLHAIEHAIRGYTNNNFQVRAKRSKCAVVAGKLYGTVPGLRCGDTVQISESGFNAGLYTVTAADDGFIDLDGDLTDEPGVLVTVVEYPPDVVACAVNMLSWEINNRDKVGIQSETLSRHSVTYFSMDGDNSVMGYPRSLLMPLRPYMKARF